MTKSEYILTFEEEARSLITRPGLEMLLTWLFNTDFYTAPASTKYHGAEESGLVRHSLAVYEEMFKLCNFYGYFKTDCKNRKESAAIVSLFHDICKVGFYTTNYKNAKNKNGQWESVPFYTVQEELPFGAHGAKSMYLIQQFMSLSAEEAMAICNHMGAWDKSNYSDPGKAYDYSKLAWLLHVADESATYIVKS